MNNNYYFVISRAHSTNMQTIIKKAGLILAFIIIAMLPVLAQNKVPDPPAWLEPVSFPATGHNICSPDSWKLVFWDNFSGNAIDNTKWITYKSWKGLQRSTSNGPVQWDHDDWSGSRHEGTDDRGVSEKNIFRDENVVVSNGTARLKIKHEPYSWKCPSCPESERQNVKYTGAALCTYYYYNGQPRLFNSGRFEFRARFPDFPHSFGTAWTWFGEHMGVNELDLAESNGANWSGNPKKDWLRGMNWKNYVGRIYHPTHAWGRLANAKSNLPPYPIPYHSLEDVRRDDNPAHFPGQSWSNFITGTMFDFTQWNTYTVEWDSIEVKTYLNHVLVDRLPKYYYKKRVGAFYIRVNPGCNADTVYQVTRGFPYSKHSGSQLRFTAGVKKDVQIDNSNDVYDMGEIELDYVGIWQRQPEPGYQEISPDTIIAPPLLPNPNHNEMGDTRSIGHNAVAIFNKATAAYSVLNTATYTPVVICAQQSFPLKSNFIFKVLNPLPGASYSWEIWHDISGTGTHFHQNNKATIITPQIAHDFQHNYTVKWKLKVEHGSMVKSYNGMRDMRHYTPIRYELPHTYRAADKSITYLEARFSEADSIAYESEVADLIATQYIDDPADTALITEIINNAYFERLEKYLYFAEPVNNETETEDISHEPLIKKSFLNLNPEQKDNCQVMLSSAFAPQGANPVHYRVMDLNKKVLCIGTLDPEQQSISLKHIPDHGLYVLELKQKEQREFIRFQRR